MTTASSEYPRRIRSTFGTLQLEIEAILFHRPMTIREVLSLKPGDLLRLQGAPGSPIDIRVSNSRLAAAELMQIHGNYAVRIIADSAAQRS